MLALKVERISESMIWNERDAFNATLPFWFDLAWSI
jgi:hypothetical protein